MDNLQRKELLEKVLVTAKILPEYFSKEERQALDETIKHYDKIKELEGKIKYEKITCSVNNWKDRLNVMEKAEKLFDEYLI